jgi:uncharacterized damage-inducible protein DinB
VNSFVVDLRTVLIRDLGAFRHEIELFPDDATVWRTLPGTGNSAGNLALHVCGNLKLFVGAVLGKTGYVRNRDAEFSDKGRSRADLMREITSTMEVVATTLERFTGDRMEEPYPATPNNLTVPTGRFLMHLAVHLGYHLGQADYLRRVLTGSSESGGGVALPALAS